MTLGLRAPTMQDGRQLLASGAKVLGASGAFVATATTATVVYAKTYGPQAAEQAVQWAADKLCELAVTVETYTDESNPYAVAAGVALVGIAAGYACCKVGAMAAKMFQPLDAKAKKA